MKLQSLLTIVAMAVVTGCSNDELPQLRKSPSEITFTPMEFGASKPSTRGSQVSSDNIVSYGVSASIYAAGGSYATAPSGGYMNNVEIPANTGYSGYYWPGSAKNVSFFAYAPYNATGLTVGSASALGYPSYTYTVPTIIGSQSDFITANVLNHAGTETDDPVMLSFVHQCADIRFLAYNQGPSSITLHSIGIYGVKYSGTFCEGTNPKWTLSSSVNSTSVNPFLLSVGSAIASGATVDVTGTSNHFIMLPQTVASGTQMFDVDATVSGSRRHYYYTLPAALELQAGKCYTYTLTLGEPTLIVDTATDIADWQVEVKYLTVSGVSSTSTWTQPSISDGDDMYIEDWTLEE